MEMLIGTYRMWALHREFRAALAELNRHSDRELTELGISRGDIVAVAYQEAERRIGRQQEAQTERGWQQAVPAGSR